MSYYYGDQTRDQIAEYVKKNAVVILPVGTTEEHGAHLPVETDAYIARYYGDRLGAACEAEGIPVLVLCTISYGFSMGVVRHWPGCPNVDIRVLMDYIGNIVESLVNEGFKKIVMLDCHGNHDCVLRTVMRTVADKHNVFTMTLSPGKLSGDVYNKLKQDPEGDIHGGEYETSVMLHIAPELVHTDKYTDVDAIRIDKRLLGPVSTWGLQNTKTDLFGDPTHSTAELGKAVMDAAVEKGVEYIRLYREHNEQSEV